MMSETLYSLEKSVNKQFLGKFLVFNVFRRRVRAKWKEFQVKQLHSVLTKA